MLSPKTKGADRMCPDGEVQRFQVVPDGNGIVSVEHHLKAEKLQVICENADGEPVGYLFFQQIKQGVIEVATVPGSGVVAVAVTPLEEADGS